MDNAPKNDKIREMKRKRRTSTNKPKDVKIKRESDTLNAANPIISKEDTSNAVDNTDIFDNQPNEGYNDNSTEFDSVEEKFVGKKQWRHQQPERFDKNANFEFRNKLLAEDPDILKRVDELDQVIKRWKADHYPSDKIAYVIGQWIRKQNRVAERNKRRLLSAVCFKCRKTGHKVADCPEANDSTEPSSNVCYKCGSTEHIVSECKLKTQGFPYAHCFVCKKIGHLSKDCEENRNGLYPNGGSCRRCGQLDHFAKDCPTKQSQQKNIPISISMQDNNDDTEEQKPFNRKPVKQIKRVKI